MKAKTNIFLILLFVFLDQFSKYIIRSTGKYHICNQDISFGLTIHPLFFGIFWLTTIFFILFSFYKKCFIHGDVCLALVLAGAFSNMLDRLYFGCVIDFIKLPFWPVFNLADIFIVLGVIMLISFNLSRASHIEK